MSLDVYLRESTAPPRDGSGIFIREGGRTVEITREEWDRRYPDREPVAVNRESEGDGTVFDYNITHNLNQMAEAAGVYEALWRPEEIGITKAAQLIQPLRDGLAELVTNPDKYKKLNPPNGWGDYDGLCQFVASYLGACERHPNASVEVSR